MKKLFLIIIGLCLCTALYADMNTYIIGAVSAGGTSYSHITFWLNFEANDNVDPYAMGSSECSDGDTSGAFAGEVAVGSTGALYGSYGMDITNTSDYMTFDVSSGDIASCVSGRVCVSFRVPTTWGDQIGIITMKRDNNNEIKVRTETTGTGEIELVWKEGGVTENFSSTTANCSTGTTYCLELAFDATTNTRAVYINGSSVISTSDAFSGFTPTAFRPGNTDTGGYAMYYDNIIFSTDYTYDFYNSGSGIYDDTEKPSGCCDG